MPRRLPKRTWLPTRVWLQRRSFRRGVDDTSAGQTRDAHVSTASPARALRAQWRRRVTSRVAGRFWLARAARGYGRDGDRDAPAASTRRPERRRGRASRGRETLSRNAHTAAPPWWAGSAAEKRGGRRRRARRRERAGGAAAVAVGLLAAGVNDGVPTIVEAFFPADAADAPETAEEHRLALVDALERLSEPARAVETHGCAARGRRPGRTRRRAKPTMNKKGAATPKPPPRSAAGPLWTPRPWSACRACSCGARRRCGATSRWQWRARRRGATRGTAKGASRVSMVVSAGLGARFNRATKTYRRLP